MHPWAGDGKAKGAKAASLSRNLSVTRVANDESGAMCHAITCQHVGAGKRRAADEKGRAAVGASISVDNMAVCQLVKPMAVGVKPVKK